jgi:hypothetical protein
MLLDMKNVLTNDVIKLIDRVWGKTTSWINALLNIKSLCCAIEVGGPNNEITMDFPL